ncbi:thioredoxin family protein [Ectobacillus antri]|uniref:thioredoxin family protein n=1 Tax=Ectobacillus antri TaxID=2486280 RepID=UPI000F5AA96E|nr:thioredoxin family protein [Ectobacillus antri]
MKKMVIFTLILVALLGAIAFVSTQEKKSDSKAEYYQNSVSLNELDKLVKDKKDLIVYFYQTSCVHCARVSPVIVPMTKDMGIDMKVIDLQKYQAGWDSYKITGTPTVIHFKDGQEVDRIQGEQEKDTFKQWFEKNRP